MRLLRRMKAEAALLIALADIGGVWPVMGVTPADRACRRGGQRGGRYLLADAQRRGRLQLADPIHPAKGSGYIVLAMGKMGAGELNYSSDIDLIVFYDAACPALLQAPSRRRSTCASRAAGEAAAGAHRRRLRVPHRSAAAPRSGVDPDRDLDRRGARLLREHRTELGARRHDQGAACAGDIAAGEALLRELAPFIWRKYLDFAAVADIHAMKRQIHAYRGHDEIAVEGHNIKLGRGGIREIEFFVQTQQLDRRRPASGAARAGDADDARRRSPTAAGSTPTARDDLDAAYRFLRVVEHRLQMVADEQTHTLADASAKGSSASPALLGFADRDAFADALLGHLRNVQRHYATLFENAPAAEAGRHRAVVSRREPTTAKRSTSSTAMGFRQPLEVSALVRRWLGGRAIARCKAASRARSSPSWCRVLLHHFARSANPDAALHRLRPVPRRAAGRGRLFSLLRQNPDLIALIALVLGTAPRLADILAHFPEVMDAVIDPSFFGALPEEGELAAGLDRSLRQAGGYEDFLDRIRIFAQEQMFLIGTRILSGTVSAEQAGEAFARLADVLIRSLCIARSRSNFAKLHGRVPDQEIAMLALGKLGGREMTATSDLDLIVIYDFDDEHPESRRAAPALRRAVFLAADAAADQRAHRARPITACSIRSTCGCARPAAPGRSRPRSTASRAIRRTRPGPGSTWR